MSGPRLTIGSLFSGVGGLELGLEQSGLGPVTWQVERDAYCRAVLAKHWPSTERYEDVVTATALPAVDILCGGFPCQDVSVAGKGVGLAGERSGLWVHFARIVGEVRPSFVVVENVPGLIRRGLATVVADLRRLGYEVVGTRIAASDFGAPHKRERLLTVAYAHRVVLRDEQGRSSGPQRQSSGIAADDGEQGATTNHDRVDGPMARTLADAHCLWQPQPQGSIPQQRRRSLDVPWWSAEPDVARVVHGLPRGMAGRRRAAEKALGNSCVPLLGYVAGKLIQDLEAQP